MQFAYVPFDFFLAFFFMTLVLAVGPLSESKQWQQADERGMNRSWRRESAQPVAVTGYNRVVQDWAWGDRSDPQFGQSTVLIILDLAVVGRGLQVRT
jgi:hypothetical protein